MKTSQKTYVVEQSVSASTLAYYYNRYAQQYNMSYPDVLNPQALVSGISTVLKSITRSDTIPDNTVLYIVEDGKTEDDDPRNARYVLSVVKGESNGSTAFAVKLFYNRTGELENLSTFENNQVVWAPDTISNSLHQSRTKHYLGFVYLLCDKSEGFDSVPSPEKELSIADLIGMGAFGNVPVELVEVETENAQTETETKQPTEFSIEKEIEEETEEQEIEEEFIFGDTTEEIEQKDDTEVVVSNNMEYEEYDDFETDYEELFE